MEDDRSFYERRLQEEMARAASEPTEGLRGLHRRWAELYRVRLRSLPRELEHQSIGENGTRHKAVSGLPVTRVKSHRHLISVQQATQASRTGNSGY